MIEAGIELSLRIKRQSRSKTNRPPDPRPNYTVRLEGVGENEVTEYCFANDLAYESGTDGRTRDFWIRPKGTGIVTDDEAKLRVDLHLGEQGYDGIVKDLLEGDILDEEDES